MPVDQKDVTDGYWYAQDPFSDENYILLKVEGDFVWHFGQNLSSPKFAYRFLARVPEPAPGDFESTQELLVKLRKELNLSATAPIMEIFRKAAILAREAVDKARQDNP